MWHFVIEASRVIEQLCTALVLVGLLTIIPLIFFAWLSSRRNPKERQIAIARRSVERSLFRAKPRLARMLLRFMSVWIVLVLLVNLASVFGLYLGSKGILDWFEKVTEMYEPFDLMTYIINLVLLTPAILAYALAERIESKARNKTPAAAV